MAPSEDYQCNTASSIVRVREVFARAFFSGMYSVGSYGECSQLGFALDSTICFPLVFMCMSGEVWVIAKQRMRGNREAHSMTPRAVRCTLGCSNYTLFLP